MTLKKRSPYRVGPLYLIDRAGYFHIQGTHDGKRIRVSTGCSDLASAMRKLDELYQSMTGTWRASALDEKTEWLSVAKVACTRHRTHAKARGIPFKIDFNDVYALMKQAQFACAVSGIPLSRTPTLHGQPDPWAPSIDRIENRHGYVRGNIRVVALAANLAMNRWGYDVLLRLSHAVVGNAAMPRIQPLTQILNKNTPGPDQVFDFIDEIA